MTPRKAPEAVLVALAEAMLEYTSNGQRFTGKMGTIAYEDHDKVVDALSAYRAAVAPLRTSDDWRPSNADPVCDPKLAQRETLEALAVALDGTWSKSEPHGRDTVKAALDAYRTECRPAPLRTRSEVDAEKAAMVSAARVCQHDDAGKELLLIGIDAQRFLRLCSEPTANETEVDENGDPIPTMYKDCGKCRYPSAGVCCGDEWCIRHHCCGHERGDT